MKDIDEMERIQKKVKRDLWEKAEGSTFIYLGKKKQLVEEQINFPCIRNN